MSSIKLKPGLQILQSLKTALVVKIRAQFWSLFKRPKSPELNAMRSERVQRMKDQMNEVKPVTKDQTRVWSSSNMQQMDDYL